MKKLLIVLAFLPLFSFGQYEGTFWGVKSFTTKFNKDLPKDRLILVTDSVAGDNKVSWWKLTAPATRTETVSMKYAAGEAVPFPGWATSFSTNFWEQDGVGFIQPSTNTDVLKYPGIPYWNHSMKLNTDGPVWYRKSDKTLRGHILVPETIPGTQTGTITCEDGGVYIYETEASDLSVTINYIDSIPAPVTFKNLGKNSALTIESIESLPFDTAGKTSITLNFGDWVRITPAETRFITERNDNQNYDDTLTSHNERINNLVKYDNKYEINVSNDSENNWNLPFELRSSSTILYNGDPLRSTQWSASSPTILTVTVDVRKYDHIVLIN